MLFKETVFVCSLNYTKPQIHIFGQNAETQLVTAGGTYSHHCDLEG